MVYTTEDSRMAGNGVVFCKCANTSMFSCAHVTHVIFQSLRFLIIWQSLNAPQCGLVQLQDFRGSEEALAVLVPSASWKLGYI